MGPVLTTSDCLTPLNELSLVGAEDIMLTVYGLAPVQWEVEGKIFASTVVFVDPLTTRAVLNLDFLKGCSVDLVKPMMTTSGIPLYSQSNNNQYYLSKELLMEGFYLIVKWRLWQMQW